MAEPSKVFCLLRTPSSLVQTLGRLLEFKFCVSLIEDPETPQTTHNTLCKLLQNGELVAACRELQCYNLYASDGF